MKGSVPGETLGRGWEGSQASYGISGLRECLKKPGRALEKTSAWDSCVTGPVGVAALLKEALANTENLGL